MILSMPEICQYAYNNGFRGDHVAFMSACAMAESSGNTEIISGVVSDGTRGYGLCQIETENVQGGNWQDPNWQMQKAFAMSNGGFNFNPWCTAVSPMPGLIGGKGCGGYGSGAAGQYLGAAYAAAAHLHVVPPTAPSTWPGMDLRLLTPPIHGHGTGVWQARMNAVQAAGLMVDAFYGPMTEYATAKYQRGHGLVPDGVVGKKTWDQGFR